MGVVYHRQMVMTDTSLSGWGRSSRCLVRQAPRLAHKWPGVESSSSSSHSLSSVPDTLLCHRQDVQHGGGVSHQSPGGLSLSLAYEVRSLPSPLDIRAHSTRGVASSQALFRGVPLVNICMAAGWSSPRTFVRFNNIDVSTAPGSQVLPSCASCVFGVLVRNVLGLAAR